MQPRDSKPWHRLKKKSDIADAFNKKVDAVIAESEARLNKYADWASMYQECSISSFHPDRNDQDNVYESEAGNETRIYNVIRITIDQLVSKLSLNRPLAEFIPVGGDYKTYKQTRAMSKAVHSLIESKNIHQMAELVGRDAALYGTGVLKYFNTEDDVEAEVVHPSKIFIDEEAVVNGVAKEVFHVEYRPWWWIIENFPSAEKISKTGLDKQYSRSGTYLYRIQEGWFASKKNGKHVISLGNGPLLVDESWGINLPFSFFRWKVPVKGWFGIGIAKELELSQIHINGIDDAIDTNFELFADPYVIVGANSGIKPEKLQSKHPGTILIADEINGMQIVTPPFISPQAYEHRNNEIARAFEQAGISQLSAQSKMPPGIRSGFAMNLYLDVESQKFTKVLRDWDVLHEDIAKHLVINLGELTKDNPDWTTKYIDGDVLKEVKWSEISLDENQYSMRVLSGSEMPHSLSGRQEYISNMIDAQMMTPQEGRKRLIRKDVEHADDLYLAPEDMFREVFETMLDGGEYVPPYPFSPLMDGLVMAVQHLSKAITRKVPEEDREKLERWIEEAQELLQGPAHQEFQAQQGGVPGPEEVPPPPGAPVNEMPPEGPLPPPVE